MASRSLARSCRRRAARSLGEDIITMIYNWPVLYSSFPSWAKYVDVRTPSARIYRGALAQPELTTSLAALNPPQVTFVPPLLSAVPVSDLGMAFPSPALDTLHVFHPRIPVKLPCHVPQPARLLLYHHISSITPERRMQQGTSSPAERNDAVARYQLRFRCELPPWDSQPQLCVSQ